MRKRKKKGGIIYRDFELSNAVIFFDMTTDRSETMCITYVMHKRQSY